MFPVSGRCLHFQCCSHFLFVLNCSKTLLNRSYSGRKTGAAVSSSCIAAISCSWAEAVSTELKQSVVPELQQSAGPAAVLLQPPVSLASQAPPPASLPPASSFAGRQSLCPVAEFQSCCLSLVSSLVALSTASCSNLVPHLSRQTPAQISTHCIYCLCLFPCLLSLGLTGLFSV